MNLDALLADLKEVTLVVVSKGRSVAEMLEVYKAGARDFGENRVQEALEKKEQMPADVRWHFIGKLQSKKINKVIGQFSLIHSVDSVELARKISRSSLNKGVRTSLLLEANTSGEASKSGLPPEEWEAVFPDLLNLEGIEVKGLMTMAPLTDNESSVRASFTRLRLLRDRLQQSVGTRADLSTLSMGMSSDYSIAIEEGATLVRIGTAIFDEIG
ncbi:MAG: Pyridoxal phosphate homeostasis protein [Chlamydiales bacterium]|nr:Pyridoxal phosphate homeostasis protein [Chlamydiales bacterium]